MIRLKTFADSLLVIVLFSVALDALAVGDSGGCGNLFGGPLGEALTRGTPKDVERELQKWLDYKEKMVAKSYGEPQGNKSQWRAREAQNLIEGQHEKDAVCSAGPLLPVAALAGNVDVVHYLIDSPMGIKPTIPVEILFSCEHDIYSSTANNEQRGRRRDAFALILNTNTVDINGIKNGRTPIQTCVAPELISLFLERGANANVVIWCVTCGERNLLDIAVEDATTYAEEGSTARQLHGLERARIFAGIGMNSIVGRSVERQVNYSCNSISDGKRWNEKTCRELSTFIKATAGTFGPQEFAK